MRLFNFFKSRGKSKSSYNEFAFAQVVLDIVGPTVEKHGFILHSKEIKQHSSTIIWRKNKQYVEVGSTTYPTDYPFYYNILLGEGDSENVLEYDWNSVAICALARITNPESNIGPYNFPFEDEIKKSVENANNHLITFGQTFLEGDLETFYKARKMINQEREPYKVFSPDKNGKYQMAYEPKSVEQKKKYS